MPSEQTVTIKVDVTDTLAEIEKCRDKFVVESIVMWFEEAVPEPTNKNRAVQIGVHFEEVGEMAYAMTDYYIAGKLNDFSQECKTDWELCDDWVYYLDKKEFLDSLCDQIVTAIGVAHMFGMDIQGALVEVDRSNWSKFLDGHAMFDENGKIKKGPNYFKPSLEKFLTK